jgi:hypothetical protein
VKSPCDSFTDDKTAVSDAGDIRIAACPGGKPAYPAPRSRRHYGGKYVSHGLFVLQPGVSHFVFGDGVPGGVTPVA